jgi:hypothetical protein
MLPPQVDPPPRPLGDSISELAQSLFARLKAMPGLDGLLEPIEAWWAQHPLRTAGLVVVEASRKLTTPIAGRHPLALIFGAALMGALLALSRPWRWIVSPALFAGLLPSLASRTIRELPVDTWLKVLGAISTPRARRKPSLRNPRRPPAS